MHTTHATAMQGVGKAVFVYCIRGLLLPSPLKGEALLTLLFRLNSSFTACKRELMREGVKKCVEVVCGQACPA